MKTFNEVNFLMHNDELASIEVVIGAQRFTWLAAAAQMAVEEGIQLESKVEFKFNIRDEGGVGCEFDAVDVAELLWKEV